MLEEKDEEKCGYGMWEQVRSKRKTMNVEEKGKAQWTQCKCKGSIKKS